MVNISEKRNNIRCKMDGFVKYTIPYWALQSLIMFFLSGFGFLTIALSLILLIICILKVFIKSKSFGVVYSIILIIYSIVFSIMAIILLLFFQQDYYIITIFAMIGILNFIISIITLTSIVRE
jgi:hypothetical protein